MTAEEYKAKRERRIERLHELADKARSQSSSAYQAARRAVEHIPFGQPILVGHHSERRHRADLNRHDRAMRRACEASDKADYYARRVESAENNRSIRSDDPDAPELLQQRIADLEAKQARMKLINSTHKAFIKNPASLDKSKLTENERDAVRGYKPTYSWEPHPFPPYSLQNNNANIRRLKDRLAVVQRAASTPTVEIVGQGVTVALNPLNGRLEIRFASKPAPETIARLKSSWWILRRKDGEWFWMSHVTQAARELAAELSGIGIDQIPGGAA